MMFNVIHGTPTKVNCKLTIESRSFKLYDRALAVEFGLQTHQNSHHPETYWYEMKGDQINWYMFDSMDYCFHNRLSYFNSINCVSRHLRVDFFLKRFLFCTGYNQPIKTMNCSEMCANKVHYLSLFWVHRFIREMFLLSWSYY